MTLRRKLNQIANNEYQNIRLRGTNFTLIDLEVMPLDLEVMIQMLYITDTTQLEKTCDIHTRAKIFLAPAV